MNLRISRCFKPRGMSYLSGFTSLVAMTGILGAVMSFEALAQGDASQSDLWGRQGERWDARGRLPDFSYAGYQSGERPIPRVPVAANVLDFGAIPNDGQDDSAAIQSAIDATDSGAILIPRGSWRLEKAIAINKSDIVLRGEGDGPGGTTFYVPFSAAERAIADGREYEMGFAWGSAGFIVLFEGNSTRYEGTIVGSYRRGDRKIQVSDASDFTTGGPIAIKMSDQSLFGSFFTHLHNERLSGWSEGTPSSWCGADGRWVFTIDTIDANNTITLKEPLPFDIRQAWSPLVESLRHLEEVGFEDLKIEFKYADPVRHLTERGYNGVRFSRVRNGWVRNITIEHADNGITFGKNSAKNTMADIRIEGRRGHHATTISGESTYNLIDGITVNVAGSDDPWIHGFTIDHGASNNVVQRAMGNLELRLDLHRDSPFENLYTEILSSASFQSGGNQCAGPHTGARLTVWNVAETLSDINKDLLKNIDSQVTIVSKTSRSDVTSADGLWIENIASPFPANLYESQLEKRLGPSAPPVTVSLTPLSVNEGVGNANIVARLSAVTTIDVEFSIATSQGTAVKGRDYYGQSSTHTIAAGETTVTFPVEIVDDRLVESTEKFDVRIYDATGAEFTDSRASIEIVDNDDESLPAFDVAGGRVVEGDAFQISVTLSEQSRTPVTVKISTQRETAINGEDYYGIFQTLTFAPGVTAQSVPIEILDDTKIESEEFLTVRLFDADGALVDVGSTRLTIIDDD